MQGVIGEIRIFVGNFPPKHWALCNGDELQIRDYAPLFSLIQNKFGGDGKVTFKLPDLRGRAPAGAGRGDGLTDRPFGEEFGTAEVRFGQTFSHTHELRGFSSSGDSFLPEAHTIAYSNNTFGQRLSILALDKAPDTTLAADALSPEGGAKEPKPHSNIPPFTTVNFIICLRGAYPELHA